VCIIPFYIALVAFTLPQNITINYNLLLIRKKLIKFELKNILYIENALLGSADLVLIRRQAD